MPLNKSSRTIRVERAANQPEVFYDKLDKDYKFIPGRFRRLEKPQGIK